MRSANCRKRIRRTRAKVLPTTLRREMLLSLLRSLLSQLFLYKVTILASLMSCSTAPFFQPDRGVHVKAAVRGSCRGLERCHYCLVPCQRLSCLWPYWAPPQSVLNIALPWLVSIRWQQALWATRCSLWNRGRNNVAHFSPTVDLMQTAPEGLAEKSCWRQCQGSPFFLEQ